VVGNCLPFGRADAQTYLGPRTKSGDMMRMGCPTCGLLRGCGRSVFPGRPTQGWVATVRVRELAAGIRWLVGTARADRISGGLALRDRRRERGIAELTQGVIAAAQQLPFDRQCRVLAAGLFLAAHPLGHLVVVGVIR
jgi:hypothetical protein